MEYNIANMTDEAIKIIGRAEAQIRAQTGNEVVLVAYQPQMTKELYSNSLITEYV